MMLIILDLSFNLSLARRYEYCVSRKDLQNLEKDCCMNLENFFHKERQKIRETKYKEPNLDLNSNNTYFRIDAAPKDRART